MPLWCIASNLFKHIFQIINLLSNLLFCLTIGFFTIMFFILDSSAWSVLIVFSSFIILLILYWVDEEIIYIKHTNLHLIPYCFNICSICRSDSAVCSFYKISLMLACLFVCLVRTYYPWSCMRIFCGLSVRCRENLSLLLAVTWRYCQDRTILNFQLKS